MWADWQYNYMISNEVCETLTEGGALPSAQLSNLMRSSDSTNHVCESLLQVLVDELVLGLVFSVHYEAKRGLTVLAEPEGEQEKQVETGPNTDIFGEPIVQKKAHKCVCPTCKHSLAASRFAPHLAKCLGLGRISSRIASRRIATNSYGAPSDDDDDGDWTTRRRRKRDRSSGRAPRPRPKWSRNGDSYPRVAPQDAAEIDVDVYEEGEAPEHSNTSSPADSASTSSSSSKKPPRARTKNSKNHRSSPAGQPALAD